MFSQNNNGFSADLLKAVREATAKGPAPRNPREVEEAMKKAGTHMMPDGSRMKNSAMKEAEGTVPKTPREKELARKHGHRGLITKGDVVKARMASEEAESVEEAMMKKADEPAAPNQAAIERRKRLQAIQDRKDDAGRGKKAEMKTSMRKVAGTAYGGSNQKDDSSDDMNEELFTDAELEAISTAAAKL